MLIQWRASSQCSVWMSSPSSGPWAGSFGCSSTTDITIRTLGRPFVAELLTPTGVELVRDLGSAASGSARHRRGHERWRRLVGHGGRNGARQRVVGAGPVLERDLLRDPRDGRVGPCSHPPTHGGAIPSGATRGRIDQRSGGGSPGRAVPIPVGDLGLQGGRPRITS